MKILYGGELMFEDFGCKVADTLYVAFLTANKVCEFKVDCLKVFSDDYTAHGYIYGLYGKWGTPTEFSLKYLDKRIIFSNKTSAEKWLTKQLKE